MATPESSASTCPLPRKTERRLGKGADTVHPRNVHAIRAGIRQDGVVTRYLVLGYVDEDAARQLKSVPSGLLTVEAHHRVRGCDIRAGHQLTYRKGR
jgi:hypothetical protein